MWKCPKCNRLFEKTNQMHSCKSVPVESHFKNKIFAKSLYDEVLATIQKNIGDFQIISLPCCVHLYGKYDFIALLPHKDSLEIRFALGRIPESKRIVQSVDLSQKNHKIVIFINSANEIDEDLIHWLKEAYFLKDHK